MSNAHPENQGWQANVRRQTRRLGYWTLAWLLTLALANFGPAFLWDGNELVTIGAVGFNLLVGIGMIFANKNHLRSLDEMQQKIQLEAMGLTLGVVLVAGLAYSSLDIANVIRFDAEIAHVVILMGLTYLVTLAALTRKLR